MRVEVEEGGGGWVSVESIKISTASLRACGLKTLGMVLAWAWAWAKSDRGETAVYGMAARSVEECRG